MGNMAQLVKMLPGMAQISEKQLGEAERNFKVFQSLIQSMKQKERVKPELLARSESRRQRIIRGSGRTEMDLLKLLSTFSGMRSRMQNLSKFFQMGTMPGALGGSTTNEEQMMQMAVEDYGPRKIAPGKVRRKKMKFRE